MGHLQPLGSTPSAPPKRAERPENRGKLLAEEERFELPVGCPTAVFKTAALDHSATPPRAGRGRARGPKGNSHHTDPCVFWLPFELEPPLYYDARPESLVESSAERGASLRGVQGRSEVCRGRPSIRRPGFMNASRAHAAPELPLPPLRDRRGSTRVCRHGARGAEAPLHLRDRRARRGRARRR